MTDVRRIIYRLLEMVPRKNLTLRDVYFLERAKNVADKIQ